MAESNNNMLFQGWNGCTVFGTSRKPSIGVIVRKYIMSHFGSLVNLAASVCSFIQRHLLYITLEMLSHVNQYTCTVIES